MHVLVKVVPPTAEPVAMLTLVRSTLIVEVLSVVNEGIRGKERFPARDRRALSNGMHLGRPSRKQHGVVWRLPSSHVTVLPYKASPW